MLKISNIAIIGANESNHAYFSSSKEIKFMKTSLHLCNLKFYNAMVLLLICFASQNSLASVMISTPPLPPPSIGILLPQGGFGFCSIDGSCQTFDASWVEWQLPSLQVGQETSISTTSSSFGFYLGNALNGQIDVSLTPVFQIQDNENFVDELTANIANRTAIFSKTHNGLTTFEAVSGIDYYLLLSGLVRGGTTYRLQLSQVPLPAAFYLFGSGLTLLLTLTRKEFHSILRTAIPHDQVLSLIELYAKTLERKRPDRKAPRPKNRLNPKPRRQYR